MVGGEGVKRWGQRWGGGKKTEKGKSVCERERLSSSQRWHRRRLEGSQALQPDRTGFKSSLGSMNLGNRQRVVCNWG